MNEEYSFGQRSFYNDSLEISTEKLQEMLNDQRNYGPEIVRVINDILEERKFHPQGKEEPEIFMNDGLESYETPESEAEKYWICPNCKKLVGIEFAVCWSCQAQTPMNLEHPGNEDILKEKASEIIFTPVKSGLSLVAGGIVIILLGLDRDYFNHLHYGRLVIGGFAVIVGFWLIIYGLTSKSAKRD